jgi:hypothetical protein
MSTKGDHGRVFKEEWISVDPDLPPGVLIVAPNEGYTKIVNDVALSALNMVDEMLGRESSEEEHKRDFPAMRRLVWQLLIEKKLVNAVVGIDWGVKDGKDETTEEG